MTTPTSSGSTGTRGEGRTALDREATIVPKKSDPSGRSAGQGRIASLMRLRRYLTPYRSRFIIMIIASVGGVAATIVVPLVTRAIIDGPIADSDKRGLYTIGAAAVALGVLEALLLFVRRWVVSKGTLGTETDIRTEMYAKLQQMPMSFHGRWDSGQLLSRMMSDLSTIRRFVGFGAVFLVTNVGQILVVVALLLQMYWPLGLVVLASTVPITLVCLNNQKHYTRLSRAVQDQTGDVASTVEEGAYGLRVIKSFGRADHMFGAFDKRARKLYDTSIERVDLSSRFFTFLDIVPNVTLIVVLGFGAVAAGNGTVTLGTLVAFITLMLSLVWPVSSMGFLLAQSQEAMTASDRIAELFDAENDVVDGPTVVAAPTGVVRFEHVNFRYHDADHDVLHDVNLEIQAGETVAVVGATGSGKTVFTSLVPRLQDVTGGKVTIDGVDVRDYALPQLRTIVATAFEDPTLFSMSARENLTLGRPDASADDITEAVEVAQAHFVYDLPWGLDTRIGEQGMSLSGGQRQRLALARAVLARPKVLVLDDTLSALDIHTEALVEEALKRVLVGVTGIVVAHRASTVLLADKVAMLNNGTITHVGTHSELLATVPEYRNLLSAEVNPEDEMDEIENESYQRPDQPETAGVSR